jgi:methionyl-tRNA formyltransferase
VVRKTILLFRCHVRLLLRRVGFRLQGFDSLPEVILAHPIKVIPCINPNSPAFVDQVHHLGVDLIIVAAFSRILKAQLIEAPPLGCINVHPSALPRYRGPNPFYWVLARHEEKTGVTIHYIDEGIDSGNIISQREFSIKQDDTEYTLQTKAAKVAGELLQETVPRISTGVAPSTLQDESQANYYSFPPKGASVL